MLRRLFDSSALIWAFGILWCGALAVVVVLEMTTGRSIPLCMFKRITGMPCATCGSTRAVIALAQGDPLRAFMLNPLVMSLLFAVPAWLVVRWRRSRTSAEARPWSGSQRTVACIAFLALFAANWVYVIWRGN